MGDVVFLAQAAVRRAARARLAELRRPRDTPSTTTQGEHVLQQETAR